MKNVFLTAFLFNLCISLVNAQYIPLLEEHKYWIYVRAQDSDHPKIYSAYLITFEGDSLISGRQYKKIWSKELIGTHPCPPPQQPCFQITLPYTTYGAHIIGFGREDLNTQKAYFLPAVDGFCASTEYEWFDFSLQTGDTLNFCLRDAIGGTQVPEFGLVDSLGSNYVFGKNRNAIITTGWATYLGLSYSLPLRIYEGIGFELFGIFHRYLSLDALYDFCEGDCTILSGTTDLPIGKDIVLYPNPAAANVYINSMEEPQKVFLIDLNGKKTECALSGNTLNLSAFEKGVYVLELYFLSGAVGRKLLVKQ